MLVTQITLTTLRLNFLYSGYESGAIDFSSPLSFSLLERADARCCTESSHLLYTECKFRVAIAILVTRKPDLTCVVSQRWPKAEILRAVELKFGSEKTGDCLPC